MSNRLTPRTTADVQQVPIATDDVPRTPAPRRSGRSRRLNVLLQSVKRFRSPDSREQETGPSRLVVVGPSDSSIVAPPKKSKAAKKRAKIAKDAQTDLVRQLAESGAENAARLESLLESAGASAPDSPPPAQVPEIPPARSILVAPPLSESLDAAKVFTGAFALSPSSPAVGPWATLFPSIRAVLTAWAINQKIEILIAADSPFPQESWTAVASFAAGLSFCASTPLVEQAATTRGAHLASVTPEPARRHYGRFSDLTDVVALGKAPKGDLATWINPARFRIPYPARTFPSLAHVWAAQHSRCKDMAVFNSASAMDEWLHDLQVSRYPHSFSRVKAQLISGDISCVWDWSSSPDYSLFNLDHALQFLIEDLFHFYGSGCELIQPLRHYRDHRLVPEAAVVRAKLASSGRLGPDDRLVAKVLEKHINLALTSFHSDNRPILEEAFRNAPPVFDHEGFILNTKGFDSSFEPLRPFHAELIARVPDISSVARDKTESTFSSGQRNAARPTPPRLALPRAPTLTLTPGSAAPECVQKAKGKVFFQVLKAEPWAKNVVCNGKPVCGNFLLRGASGCIASPCPRVHISADGVLSESS